MDRNEAKRAIIEQWREIMPQITQPARHRVNGEKSYICPLCGNGSGKDGTGIAWNRRSTGGRGLKCFKCGFSGDIIDLYQKASGADFSTALSFLAAQIGINIDNNPGFSRPGRPQAAGKPAGGKFPVRTTGNRQEGNQAATEGTADYTAYYKKCLERLTDPAAVSYLQARGISTETAAACYVGYDPAADPAAAPGELGDRYKRHPCPRIIIPTSRAHYVARSTDPATPARYQKINPNTDRGAGAPGIFNRAALYRGADAVFITEGAFDALSIIEAGGQAVALNSTANADILTRQLERKPTAAALILSLDNDEAGRQAAGRLGEGLRRLGIHFTSYNISAEHKDPNEALTADRAAFFREVEKAQREATGGTEGKESPAGDNLTAETDRTAGNGTQEGTGAQETRPDNVQKYLSEGFLQDIKQFGQPILTGFDNLDRQAGGLYAGLYVLAAIPSLGKTTFALQIADNIAAGGREVLFFSLEMGRFTLVSKSLARTARTEKGLKVTSLEIRRGLMDESTLTEVIKAYTDRTGERLSIIEGAFCYDINAITQAARSYQERTGKKPVIIIDYLQIIRTAGTIQGAKETVDFTITELKRLSEEMKTPVIVISSMNRENYLSPVDFKSLKESGAIEYSSDVVFGMNLQCLEEPVFDTGAIKKQRGRVNEAKAESPRKIALNCLKDRFGIATFNCYFNYYPEYDLFTPAEEPGALPEERKAARKI